MHGCGAASSKGSFQGLVMAQFIDTSLRRAVVGLWRGCDLLVAEPGTWNPSMLT